MPYVRSRLQIGQGRISGSDGEDLSTTVKEELIMPIVQIELLQGRTVEQKRKLAEKVTEAIAESISCPRDAVSIIIREMAPEHFAKGGILRIDNK